VRLVLTFLRAYALRYWLWYLAGIVCLLGVNWLAVQIPVQMAAGVDALRAGELDTMRRAAGLIAAMGVGVIVVRTLSRALIFTPGRLVEYQLRGDLFAHLTALPRAFYDRRPVGDLVSRASNDITFVRVLTGFGILQLFNVSAALALTGAEMVRLSPRLTGLMLIPVLVSVVVVQLGTRRLFTLVRENQQHLAALSDHILASLQGVQTIQGFNASGAFLERFSERNRAFMETALSLARIQAIVLPLLALGGAASLFVLLAVGGPMAGRGELSVGELVAFTGLLSYLLMPLRSLGWLISIYQRGQASLARIYELLDEPAERPGERAPAAGFPGPEIEVKGLSFAYPDAPESAALTDVSLRIPAGGKVGIFGRTGAGKTTLLRLLTRSYDPPPGTITADGVDLRELELAGWRAGLAVVPQSPFLFSETIADNVTLGDPDPARLARSLERAALDGEIERFPDGLMTIVGERGVMLSGGQRQRAALARALYREGARLVVLDDVLSAVDHRTEQQIIASLEALAGAGGGPTLVVVSHRVSVLARCDQVVVMEGGRVVDQGSHAALLGRPGPYRDAWEAGDAAQESAK
jgi:ATP-binding cassette subfamily B multidrug efflux pump